MYAGGLKWGSLSQLLPEALLSRIQNLAHRKSTAQKIKDTLREEHENTLCFVCFIWVSFQTGFTAWPPLVNTDTQRLTWPSPSTSTPMPLWSTCTQTCVRVISTSIIFIKKIVCTQPRSYVFSNYAWPSAVLLEVSCSRRGVFPCLSYHSWASRCDAWTPGCHGDMKRSIKSGRAVFLQGLGLWWLQSIQGNLW